MADLHKFSVQEAVNTEAAGKWTVQTVVTTSGTDVTDVDVSEYHNVIIDCTSTICVLFDTTSTGTGADGDNLELPTGIHSLKVPHGLGNTIYLHWLRNGAVNATVRMILT